MAISVFQLASVLTESAAVDTTAPYEFATDNLQECTGEMNYMIMSEAADYREIMVSTSELLTEAAINNPGAVDTLDENIFTTLKDGIINFFNKIIAMVKGLIEKIKAFFYKMTGKTSKWVSIMKPKIDKAKLESGHSDVSAEQHTWDTKFVLTEMQGVSAKLVDGWRNALSGDNSDPVSSLSKFYREFAEDEKGSKADDPRVKAMVSALDNDTKSTNSLTDKFKDKFIGTLAGLFDVKSGADLNSVWAEVAKKAHGGTNEKTERKYGSDDVIDSMFKVVERSKDTIDTMKKNYENHLKHLTQYRDTLQKSEGELSNIKDTDKIPSEIVRAAREAIKATYNKAMTITQTYETAMNTARQMNTSFVQDMTTEYMTLLTKFAGFKGKKA